MDPLGAQKPVLFETATLLGFIFFGLLGLRIDSFIGLSISPPTPYNYFGIVSILVGVTLRFWASSTIFDKGKGTPLYSRPPTALVTSGPYQLIRNPLYLGGFLIYFGILVTIPSLFLTILGLIGLPITFIGISREEKGLERRFGVDYRQYKQNVPGWLPRKRSTSPAASGHV
jgi:protein-S-isoprenylcysteine O-methyltransferase Ste14